MFEKTVINALASPELVGELRVYNRRLKLRSRQFGTIAILFALFITLQYVGLVFLPESPVASPSDTIYGGVSNTRALITDYEDTHSDFRAIAQALGISSKSLQHITTNTSSLQFNRPMVIWSPSPTYNPAFSNTVDPTPAFSVKAGSKIYYGYLLKEKTYQLPAKASWMVPKPNAIILKQTGNIITTWEHAQNVSFCYKSPESLNLSYLHCPNGQQVKTSIEIKNLSYKTDAVFIKSAPGDNIEYKLIAKNISNESVTISPEINIDDILEYATLENYSGATTSGKGKVLNWPTTVIPPHTSLVQSFVIKMKNRTSLVAQGSDNANSYDCELSAYYGTSRSILIRCPLVKNTERLLHLPSNTLFLIVYWIGFLVSVYLYAKNILLYKETFYILRHLRRKHD